METIPVAVLTDTQVHRSGRLHSEPLQAHMTEFTMGNTLPFVEEMLKAFGFQGSTTAQVLLVHIDDYPLKEV